MCNRHDDNYIFINEIDRAVRKLAKDVAVSSVNKGRPAVRCVENCGDGVIDVREECDFRRWASAPVPLGGVLDLFRSSRKNRTRSVIGYAGEVVRAIRSSRSSARFRRGSSPCAAALQLPKPLGRLRRFARPRGYRAGRRQRCAIIFGSVTAFAKRSSTMLIGPNSTPR